MLLIFSLKLFLKNVHLKHLQHYLLTSQLLQYLISFYCYLSFSDYLFFNFLNSILMLLNKMIIIIKIYLLFFWKEHYFCIIIFIFIFLFINNLSVWIIIRFHHIRLIIPINHACCIVEFSFFHLNWLFWLVFIFKLVNCIFV